MNVFTIFLIALSVAWGAIVFNQIIPILSFPLARSKRDFVWLQFAIGTFAIIIEWISKTEIHPVSIIMLMCYQLITTFMFHLLAKLDYYIDDLLQEVLLLAVLFSGAAMMTSVWNEGLAITSNVFVIRLVVVLIGAVLLVFTRLFGKSTSSLWSLGVYLFLIVIKWLTVPYWGIWSLVLLFVYATLVGYVIRWMVTTTYAEKVLAWNISPSKIWVVLTLAAGVLVLAF